jgi:NitT/TauT family transport system permease protein
MVIPIVWGSLCTAITETDKDLLEMAKLYRFGTTKTIRLIYVPSALPLFKSACNTSIGLSWKSGIAAEVLCLPRFSVGTYLYYSKIYLETPSLFAWTAVVIILSFALEKLFGYFFKKRGALL